MTDATRTAVLWSLLGVASLTMLTGCTSGAHVAAQPTSPPMPTSPAGSNPPSPVARPALRRTRVSGVYTGRARLVRTDVRGVSHRAQRIRWILRPRCPSGACAVRLVSTSGGYDVVLHRHGARYVGVTARPGFFTCAGSPERVRLRVAMVPTASARIDHEWIVTRVRARLRNVSAPSVRCHRSFLVTVVEAQRRR